MNKVLGTIETELFETATVQPHFINDCCFGEDLAAWLREWVSASELTNEGFTIGAPVQEDYGWGLRVDRGKASFWVALSFVGDGPTSGPGEWAVEIEHSTGFIARMVGKADVDGVELLANRIVAVFEGADGIKWSANAP